MPALSSRRRSVLGQVSIALGAFAFLLGAIAGVERLLGPLGLSPAAGFGSVSPMSAAALALTGAALVALGGGKSERVRLLGRCSAGVVLGIAGYALLDVLLGGGLDVSFVAGGTVPTEAAGSGPMSVNSALAFLFGSAALLAMDQRRTTTWAEPLAAGTVIIAFQTVVGYAYGAELLYSLPGLTEMAPPVAAGLLCVAFGLLGARPERGLVGRLTGPGAGPLTARLLLPLASVLPFLVGLLIIGVGGEPDRTRLSESLMVVLITVGAIGGVAWAAWRVHVVDRERARATQQRDELMAVVTHDLRNALTPLMGAADLLGRGDRQDGPAWEARARQVIRQSMEHSMRLIGDLSDLHAIDRGGLKIRTRPQPLAPLLRDVIDMTRHCADRCQTDVELALDVEDGLGAVEVDRDRLVQALRNLLRNACEHSPAGALVTVAARRAASGIRISVSDDGPGIAPEDLPRVFDRFWSGRTDEGGKGGSGLGLAITREIVEAMGGTVRVESAPGRGAAFHLLLPAVGRIRAARPPEVTPSRSDRPVPAPSEASGA